jgi:response regulator NasT
MQTGHVLLVDDDRLILGTVGRGLRDAGYKVVEAASGDEALASISQGEEPVDIAIVDINMPGMSGVELADRLSHEYGIPSLFLTAYSDQKIVDEAVAKGAVGYLVKPVDVPQLIPSVEAALVRARDFRALFRNKGNLEKALAGGRKVSISIGILMERRGLSEQQAFEVLRRHARSRQARLDDVATELVAALETLNTTGSIP